MVPAPPQLPTRFPCWCRAVYSWGGESQRDLGFVEGDLIECLNAGDGSWWTGRLRRNKTVGVFPSNFVEVLPDSFRPVTRSTSPLIASNTPSPTNGTTHKSKKPFRKPFEAYAKAPHYTTAKQPEIIRDMPERQPSKTSIQQPPNSSQSSLGRAPTPSGVHAYGSRAPSPAPPIDRHGSWNSRAPSPAPPVDRHGSWNSRAPSPAPPVSRHGSWDVRGASPAPPVGRHGSWDARGASPAPPVGRHGSWDIRAASPAPPAARHGSWDARAPSPAPAQPLRMSYHGGRAASPQPPPLHYNARAPSPLPFDDHYGASAPSPQPPMHCGSRAPSPQPPLHFGSRAPSPAPSAFIPYRPGAAMPKSDSPPPPPPPPHRHALLNRGGSNASYDNRPRTPRAPSPCPPSPNGDGFTPSPLREAMDGVIESLSALGTKSQEGRESPEPSRSIWSHIGRGRSAEAERRARRVPQTSMGVALQDEGYETYSGNSSQENTHYSGYGEEKKQHLPQLNTYVDRMETRLRKMHQHSSSMGALDNEDMPPPPPQREHHFITNDQNLRWARMRVTNDFTDKSLLMMTSTTKTVSTNASSGTQATNNSTNTQSTNRSLMSGVSASGISATSAGSLARKNRNRARSALGFRDDDNDDLDRPNTPFSGISYHASHSSSQVRPQSQAGFRDEGIAAVGGLVQPGNAKPKKSNFIKRILEATKTGVASGRSSLATGAGSGASSPMLSRSTPNGVTAISGGSASSPQLARDAGREMGLSNSGVDWVQVRRDVNRSNTLSKNERSERRDRCQMLDYPAIDPVDEFLESIEGGEGADGMPVHEPTNYQTINLGQVDKNSRFISNLPPMTTAVTLATTYVCRPYRSDVQKLRAIFTWVAEKINWEEDFEGDVDTRRVIQTKRGCAEEYAVLVHEMCVSVGLHSEIVRGYLKTPGEIPETNIMPRSNHWWNAVIVDNEWRIMDCCLASASNPQRGLYSSSANVNADSWWFLTRPSEICWTHIPEHHSQQHLCPPVSPEILLNLPGACPPYFRNELAMVDYNTSLTRIEDLEMVHVKFNVPADIEVAAEVEVRAFTRDSDGDLFESGDTVKKRALAQAEWYNGVKRYTVKALLPGDEGTGVLKVYAGKRGLMHSIKDIPHPLAFALPVIHTGENPPYEFVTRHPTPHAQRHDIYVVQPQCQRLALNNTFVFAIRQHPSLSPSSSMTPATSPGAPSPIPFARPGSAMSMSSSNPSTVSSSGYGGGTSVGGKKPAKLAIQTPGGKILRLMRKEERRGLGVGGKNIGPEEEVSDGGTWETIIKCSERGVWRGLVLADRTARWCVFAEWVCMG
ncbi:cytokinesis protein cyk3 [Apiospora phragmitis]|uniref:Cytokinesis protein cyk3 n=1 Tax=Apiospora phragmitis TaxID=2905665 RepID=A0ABR1SUR9_9PEZI